MSFIKMGNLAIIPARGGSKRIPKKNIKDFLGKPIIAYSIEVAIKSKLFDEVMVSTEDEEVAEVARKYGAKVPFFRSKENAGDYATTFDVIEEVISSYRSEEKIFEKVCCLYPCAPFVSTNKIEDSYNLLIEKSYDTVLLVVVYSFPVQRSFKLVKSKIQYRYPEHETTRSQDLEKAYHDAGQLYWMDVEQVLSKKKIITNNTGAVIISELEVQDIDDEIDWRMAELKFKQFSKS